MTICQYSRVIFMRGAQSLDESQIERRKHKKIVHVRFIYAGGCVLAVATNNRK